MKGARANGYVSLLVAVTVAMLALAALAALRVQGDLSPALRRLRDDVRLETIAQTAEARVAFLLTTEPVGGASIEIGGDRNAPEAMNSDMGLRNASGRAIAPVRLDGRAYLLDLGAQGMALVSIQDEAGLLNLNAPDENATRTLLANAGVQDGRARRMAAALADFVDGDDLARASGAEGAAYRGTGMAAPPNAALLTPWSALGVIDWADALDAVQRAAVFTHLSALRSDQAFNINTAPAEVIASRFNIDRRTLRALLERRETSPLQSTEEAEGYVGALTNPDGAPLGVATSSRFRIAVRLPHTGEASRAIHESQLVVAAGASVQPVYWRLGSVRREVRRANGRDELNGVEHLPSGATELPS